MATATGMAVNKFQNGNVKANMIGEGVGDIAQIFIGTGEEKMATKGVVALDNMTLIHVIEGGEKAAVVAAIGDAKPIISQTAIKEFLVKGDKQALKSFMGDINATVAKKGTSSDLIKKLQQRAQSLRRVLHDKDASVVGNSLNNAATLITRDKSGSDFNI